MSIIRPELARMKSDENAWLKLSVIARRALNLAIDNGKTKVRVHYRNHYEYFWSDIRILEQIGYELDYFDSTYAYKDCSVAELSEKETQSSYIEISW